MVGRDFLKRVLFRGRDQKLVFALWKHRCSSFVWPGDCVSLGDDQSTGKSPIWVCILNLGDGTKFPSNELDWPN